MNCDKDFLTKILSMTIYERFHGPCERYCRDDLSTKFCYEFLWNISVSIYDQNIEKYGIGNKSYLMTSAGIYLVMLLLGFYLYSNRNLRMHPYKLYAFEILACSCYFQSFVSKFMSLQLSDKINDLLLPMMMMEVTYKNRYMVAAAQIVINEVIFWVTWLIYPLLNMLLYVDLYWIIKDPFYPQKRRNKIYNILMLICVVIGTGWTAYLVFGPSSMEFLGASQFMSIIFASLNIFFGLISLILIIRIVYLLNRQGTSKNLKKIMVIRYILLFLVFIP